MALRRGFTLIELLVVIAIMVALISLLVPSLAKAREQSRRSACGVKLRTLATGFQVYASESDQVCPVGVNPAAGTGNGHQIDTRDASFLVYWQKTNPAVADFIGIGHVWQIGAVTDKKAFFCPSASINMEDWLPGEKNPLWPPVSGNGVLPVTANTDAFGMYSIRPSPPSGLPNRGGAGFSYLKWRSPVDGEKPYFVVDVNCRLPKMMDMGNSALVSDMPCGTEYLDKAHKDGVNVGYVDGSVRWCKREMIKQYLSTKAIGATWSAGSDLENNLIPIWNVFDRN